MFFLTLKLCAVYLGTVSVLLLLVRRWVCPLRLRTAAFLVLAPTLLTGRAILSANIYAPLDIAYNADPLLARREALGVAPIRTAVLGDVVYQMLPWQKAVRESLKNGHLPLWNRFVLAGEPLLAVQQHGALHPTFLAGLFLPLPQAWTLSMTLRIFLALLCAYLFFRELGCRETSSLFGAASWALSDFLVFFLGYPLNAAVGPFPLLLLGLRRLAQEPGRRPAAVTLVALLLMTTAGHPEGVLHCVAGAGVYFLFELGSAGRGRRLRPIAFAILSGVLALGLSAVLFLPFREALVRTAQYRFRLAWYARVERSVPVPVSLERSIKNVMPYAFGTLRHHGEKEGFFGAAGYAGAVLLPLALAGLFSGRRERWPFVIIGFLGFAAWARLPGVNDAICKLPLFDVALNDYLAVLGTFSVVTFAVLGMDRLIAEQNRERIALACGLVVVGLLLLFFHAQPNLGRVPAPERWLLLAIQIVPLVLLGLGSLFRTGSRVATMLPVGVVALLLVERRLEVGSLYPTAPARALAPSLPFVDAIPRGSPNRMAAVANLFLPNIAALYELEDVRGYEAMTFAPLIETFPLWCVDQPIWFNRINDPTRPFLSFLNVRYFMVRRTDETPPGWRLLAKDPGGLLLENPSALPRAFVPRQIIWESDPTRQRERLLAISDFAETGVVEGAASAPRKNGKARVDIVAYAGQKLELSIEAKEKTLVATSMTGWPGWRLTVDGMERPLLVYNRAFLAFEVPAGRHRAVLSYWPRSFVAGLWISGLSLIATIGLFAWPRRWGMRAGSVLL